METYFTLRTWVDYIIPAIIAVVVILIIVFCVVYSTIYDKIQKAEIRKLITAFKEKGYTIRAVKSYGTLPHKYLVKDLGDGERFKYIFLYDLERKSISEIREILKLEKSKIGYYSDRQMKFIDEE